MRSSDLSRAVRSLRRHWRFTAAAVLTLAIGIGATTTIFSVVYGVLIKPLPYPNADELVSLRHMAPGVTASKLGLASSMYVTYRDENHVFDQIGLWSNSERTVTGLSEAEQVGALAVTDGTLQALGVQPLLGRWFSDAEYKSQAEGADPVIVSHAFWQRRFGGDRSAIGRTFSLDSRPSQIVGIMPQGFRFLDLTPQPDVIAAIQIDRGRLTLGNLNYSGLARLKHGVTLEEANTDLARMLPIWVNAWPVSPRGVSREAVTNWRVAPALRPLKDDVVGDVAGMLWLLMGSVGGVFLIACANTANLLLVRADARRQELAIRATLGADRRRIADELLRESFVLGAAGGMVGLAVAYAGLKLLAGFAPANLPRVEDIGVGPPVLAFVLVAAPVSSLLFGLIPALRHALGSDARFGTASARGTTVSRERNRTRNTLIVVQVMLALVLLVGAGLMMRTFRALSSVAPGFTDPQNVQVARIWIPPAAIREAERYTRVQREILERIAALPGVTKIGFGSALPLEGRMGPGAIFIEDRPSVSGQPPPTRHFELVSPGYIEALGTRLVAGRDLAWADLEQGGKVVLISENLARELWGEPEAAIGKRIRGPTDAPGLWRKIIGVTQDVHNEGLYHAPPPIVYWPAEPAFELRAVSYVIRSDRAGTESFVNEVRRAVSAINPDLPVFQVRTLQEIYSGSLARTAFMLVLLTIAGAMALLLSVVGIYGSISYIVSQRSREIGIRLALGAEPRAVKRMFLRQGLFLTAVGLAIGLGAAIALTRLMSSLLFAVSPLDPVTFAAAAAGLIVAALVASYLPSRRATKVDPMDSLRAE